MRNRKTQQMVVRQDQAKMDDSQISPDVTLWNPDGTPYSPEAASAELDLSSFPDPSVLMKAGGALSAITAIDLASALRTYLRRNNDFHWYNVETVPASSGSASIDFGNQYQTKNITGTSTINVSNGSVPSPTTEFLETYLLLTGAHAVTFSNVTWLSGSAPSYVSGTIYHFFSFNGGYTIFGRSLTAEKGDPGQVNVSATGPFASQTITIPNGSDLLSFGPTGSGSDLTVADVTLSIDNDTDVDLVGVLTVTTTYNLVDWPSSDDGDAICGLDLQIDSLFNGDPWCTTNTLLKDTAAVFNGSTVLPAILGEITFRKEITVPVGGADLIISKLGNVRCSLSPSDDGYLYFDHNYSFIGG